MEGLTDRGLKEQLLDGRTELKSGPLPGFRQV